MFNFYDEKVSGKVREIVLDLEDNVDFLTTLNRDTSEDEQR